MENSDRKLARRAGVLVRRLERLSSDSSYAHQASGLRGAIIRGLDARKRESRFSDENWMQNLIDRGERILIEAARLIPDSE